MSSSTHLRDRTTSILTPHARTRSLQAVLALVGGLVSAGCVLSTEEAEGTASIEQRVENGVTRPSVLNGGAIRLQILAAPSSNKPPEFCSGQVISRNTLLTAAHCFSNVGYFPVIDGQYPDPRTSAPVLVQHQKPDGSWETLADTREELTVDIPVAYLGYTTDTPPWRGSDVAVVRRSTPWNNIERSDVTALARSATVQPEFLYLYGYGYKSDTVWDSQLRQGLFRDLTYDTLWSSNFYKTIRAVTGPNDAHSCSHDSGGPWKNVALTPTYSRDDSISGVQFAVQRSGHANYLDPNPNANVCTELGSYAVMVAFHIQWIRDLVVNGGGGSCSNTTHGVPMRPSQTPTRQTVSTMLCW